MPKENTATDMKNLRRGELLQVILMQSQEIDRLTAENTELTARLEDKRIRLDKAGDIAHAVLELNHVFSDAEEAVKQYKENIYRLSLDQELKNKQIEAEAQQRAEDIVAEAEVKAKRIKEDAIAYWDQLSTRLEKFYSERDGLREMIGEIKIEVHDEQ